MAVFREWQTAEGSALRQPTLFMQRGESERRNYVIKRAPSLFGHWTLPPGWADQGNRLGRMRTRPAADYADGLAALDPVGRMRERRAH